MKKIFLPLSMLSFLNIANGVECEPTPPAACYEDPCCRVYCLGPTQCGSNASVCPFTCNGDLTITVAGFYWNAHQDGMEYAIDNQVKNPNVSDEVVPAPTAPIIALNNLTSAEYQTPKSQWDWGFKIGLGYCTTCDGWDIDILWTWYQGKANDHIEAEIDDNHTLLPLWSAFAPAQGSILYATDIETHWKLKLNLIDLELGRNFWTSPRLAIRPFVGIRIAYLFQDWDMQFKGGSWSERTAIPLQDSYNGEANIKNNYKGVGLRAGLNSTWNFGCGWALYGNWATSILYGRFTVDYDEENRLATAPNNKTKIAEFEDTFRASRIVFDLDLGVQWQTMFCDCQYGFLIALGFEQHLFFDQNQMWRIFRVADLPNILGLPNNTGENLYQQRRGDLDTQGWTIKVTFSF